MRGHDIEGQWFSDDFIFPKIKNTRKNRRVAKMSNVSIADMVACDPVIQKPCIILNVLRQPPYKQGLTFKDKL
jgi:hypothetical protein